MNTQMFEYMAAYDDTSRTAGRKALALARARATKRFARFLSMEEDKTTRLALVAGDLAETVKQACADAEYDDWEGVLAAVTEHLGGIAVDSARRPKMCPVHREITDVSLQQGDPQAGFAAMAQHMFSENSCRGSWEGGRCNFKPEMVTQSYWDTKAEKAEERRRERQQQQEQTLEPQMMGVEVPGDEINEPVADGGDTIMDNDFDFDQADQDFDNSDTTLDNSPEPQMAMAARTAAIVPNPIFHGGNLGALRLINSKKPGLAFDGQPFDQFAAEVEHHLATKGMPQYESIEVTHPHPDWEQVAAGIAQTGNDGPLRQYMDQRRQQRGQQPPGGQVAAKTAEALETVDVTKGGETPLPKMDKQKWTPENVTFIDTEMSGSPHPTEHQDIKEPIDHKADPLEHTRTVTETQDVEKSSNPTDGGGPGGSWTRSNGASPVTSAQDPDRNPIRDAAMLAEFPLEEDVAAAIEAYQGR